MSVNAHPSFEHLSAYHDGEAPEWAAHVEACAICRSSVDELATLSAYVAGPVPASDPTVGLDSTGPDPVARALAAGLVEARTGAGPGDLPLARPGAAPAASIPVPLPPYRRTPVPPAPGPDRSRWMGWMTVASAAAVVLLVVGMLALMTRGGGGGDTTTTALDDRAESDSSVRQPESAAPGVAGPGAGTGSRTDIDGAVFGGDLGEVPDAAALVTRAGLDLRAGRDRLASDAQASTAPPVTSRGGQGILPADPATPGVVGTRPCEMQARDRNGDLGPVVYYATATRTGVPAVVLGFAAGGGTGPVTAQVLAQADCRLLLSASLP